MKKITAIIIALVLVIIFLSACGPEPYQSDFNEGYDLGYEVGREDGYERGYEDGCDDGEEGYDAGYKDGYADGELDGYYAGATYTCLFFGDVDRAFKSADNGGAWLTFLDGYDEYISDIFDEGDGKRSDLFWAFISVTLSEDATDEEKNLLISTFGADLFTRNGIHLG